MSFSVGFRALNMRCLCGNDEFRHPKLYEARAWFCTCCARPYNAKDDPEDMVTNVHYLDELVAHGVVEGEGAAWVVAYGWRGEQLYGWEISSYLNEDCECAYASLGWRALSMCDPISRRRR